MTVQMFENMDQDGETPVLSIDDMPDQFVQGTLYVSGNLGGGTITVYVSDGNSWFELTSFSSTGMTQINQGFSYMMATLSGSTNPKVNLSFVSNKDDDFFVVDRI